MDKLSASGKVTGFASPAQGYEDTAIDLNNLLIKNPAATYFFRLDSGDMETLGLLKGALLVVDRSKTPVLNNFVLIRHEGQFLCRLMTERNGSTVFTNNLTDIKPTYDDTEIIGVVTTSIKEH
ncbi:hypothetical protein R84B8_00645 [Treponema sp. R8-4-B8]